ncbi:MAG: protoporphyrinogen oxidase [Candidatus Acidiferrales bacterium]|jgi:oxygen-dependent protoporphyrinogen oxidase
MNNPTQVAVIGAGISGLACAYRLQQLGLDVTVFESNDCAGGLIDSVQKEDLLFEAGPQSFQGTPTLLALIRELGLEPQLQKADPRAPRYVLLHGRLRKIPMSPQALLASTLLNPVSRWKIATEPFKKSQPPTEEESVATFVRRKFGNEILEYLVAPFVSGVYAGDPEKLSLKAAFPTLDEWERQYGSVLRGAMKSRPPKEQRAGAPPLCSFTHGVATLPRAMAAKLGDAMQYETRAVSVDFARAGEQRHTAAAVGPACEIRFVRNGQEQSAIAGAVVIATPAYAAARLLETSSPHLAQALSGIAYAPVAVVASTYYRQQVGDPLEGFGFLVPRGEKVRTLGTVWNSSLFPGRAHEGSVTITSFIGGATDPEIMNLHEENIAAIVAEENARILGITGPPVEVAVWKYPRALPQYNLGHGHIVETIRDAERASPGLFFAGNYLEGPAVGKCVENGFQTAEAVSKYLQIAQ